VNPPKVQAQDYIDFLIATPNACSATEASRVSAIQTAPPAHDAFTRLLHRLEPDAETLWQEAKGQVSRTQGVLVVDDSTLDKPYARQIDLVQRHWSGKHASVVSGINLITLLWSDGDRHVPTDYCLYDKRGDGLSKHDHFQTMLTTAKARGFQPACVLFDSWYGSLANLKQIRDMNWIWLTQLKANRLVSPERGQRVAVSTLPPQPEGRVVHLQGYGMIRLFVIATPDGDNERWATNDLTMRALTRTRFAGYAWTIETYHRGIKQFCHVERAQVRAARAQRNHIGLALRAFLRLESYCHHHHISWWEAKRAIVRDAVRAYLATPIYQLVTVAVNPF